MRGIQINNFFNNHISLNGKKINNNHPTNVYQPTRPQPLVINHIPKNDDPQQIIISNAVTPQMKSKQISNSGRKNRSNTIAPGVDKKDSRRSKQKFSVSQQQIRRPFSAQKYKQIDTSQQHQFSKPFKTSSNKLKPSISKIQKGSGVKRSKSAIIKRPKPQQNNQISKQFVKESKKNIINSVDNTLKKNSSKKLLKKQTQNLLKQKQKTQRGQCRTARVQSNFVKPRKISDKIASQLKGFDNSNMDLKLNKFNTQKKSARTAVTKSYLTSAKQSKPLSARQRKLKKKLFNSKQKYHIKIQDRSNQQYQEYLTSGANEQQQNSQVNQAISQLQQALQNINSKKALAKQLKKFTNKLKQIADKDQNKSQSSSSSPGQVQEYVDFTNQAFKKLKKQRFQKKLDKNIQKRQTIISNKQASKQHSHSKKSSQKKLSKKQKLQQGGSKNNKNAGLDTQQKQAIKKIKNIQIKLNKRNNQIDYNSPIKQIQQPSPFHNYESDESKYTQSKNNSGQKFIQDNDFLYNMNDNSINQNIQQTKTKNLNQSQVLDQNNIKYMEFLKNLQAEHNTDYQNYQSVVKSENKNQIESYQNLQEQEDQHYQKSQNLIDQINNYLNNAATNTLQSATNNTPLARLYDSEKNQQEAVGQKGQKVFNNPILQRRRIDNLPHQINRNLNNGLLYGKDNNKYEIRQMKNNNLSDHDDEQADDTQSDEQQNKLNRMNQIQKLKQFSKQSDKMMEKIAQSNSNKNQNKKKNLTLQIITNNSNNQDSNRSDSNPAIVSRTSTSSPKYDDRYPHLLKSPKFSDIEITNILAIKQKFLGSKHQKMNQLIQKMYQKQLVSPKSYEYSMYQLKKRFQQETDGLDGFRQQASQILKQINKHKDDIKDIDQLIREERWQEARKLMKIDSRSASVFIGFKKNKDNKIYEQYQGWEKVEVRKPQQVSPSKRPKIQVVPNNICISIQPTIENKKVRDQKTKQQKPQLIRQDRLINPGFSLSDSQSSFKQQNQFQSLPDSITQKLEYQFQNKYRLKSNQSYQNDKNYYSQDLRNLQQEVSDYLNVQKADSQDFQNYVYYHSQQNQDVQISENNSGLSQRKAKQLREQGMFKLIQVQNDNKNTDQDLEQSQIQSKNDDLAENLYQNETKTSRNQNNQSLQKKPNNVIEIYDLDVGTGQQSPQVQIGQQKKMSLIKVPNISQVSTLLKKPQDLEVNQQHSDNSLIELEVRKGFESNLFFIKQYCISLCQYIRDNQQKKLKFKENISQPLQFDNIQLLKKYRQRANGEYDNRYNSTLAQLQYKKIIRKPVSKAISEELADQFNKSYGQLKFYNIDLNRKNRKRFQMQKQSEKKFLAAILQVLNESLDFQRPGSIFGKPLPWANNSKYLKNMKYLNGDKKKKIADDMQQSAQTYDFIFGVAIARIIQWGSCLCGFLPDTAELQNTQIDQDYVVHIRQTRMAFLLQKMLAQEQATINNSQLQQTEVVLCLGRQIIEQLFKQAGQQIIKIQQKNSHNDNE